MTKEEFLCIYKNVYILVDTMENLDYILKKYASNYDSWQDPELSNPNFIKENKYNKKGIIISFDNELYASYGTKDEDIDKYIHINEILNRTKNIEENKMNEITEILEKLYENPQLRKTIIPLFISHPGMGKTTEIMTFAKSKGIQVVEMIASQMSPFEVSGIAIPDKDVKQMVYYDFDRLVQLKDGDMIFVDELLNGNPNVLNAFLTLFESRKTVSGKDLPNIIIVAAANRQGMAPLTPQIKERFVWYDLTFNSRSWIEFMIKKYNITKTIGEKLCNLITNEKFLGGENFMTPRSIDKAVNMLTLKVPTPYKSKVLPILKEMVSNNTNQTIMIGDQEFLPYQQLKWIDIYRLMNNIK